MDGVEARFDAFAELYFALEVVGGIFLALIVAETVWDVLAKRRKSLRESGANFVIGLGGFLLERSAFGLVFVVGLLLAEPFAVVDIPLTWWSWVLAVLVADFSYYWMHRLEHEIRILWAYHSVHHSSPEFNLTTALRLAWVEGLVEWLFFVPLIVLGFDALQIVIAVVVVVDYQTWIRTEKIGKLGWADRVFNTPSVHRVHHGSNDTYIDKNYGGILIIWDRLFGSFQAEKEPVIYGIKKLLGTSNPIVINVHEFWQIAKDVARARSISEAFQFAFGRPN